MQYGQVVSALDLKSCNFEFKSHSGHSLGLFQVNFASTPYVRLYLGN